MRLDLGCLTTVGKTGFRAVDDTELVLKTDNLRFV